MKLYTKLTLSDEAAHKKNFHQYSSSLQIISLCNACPVLSYNVYCIPVTVYRAPYFNEK